MTKRDLKNYVTQKEEEQLSALQAKKKAALAALDAAYYEEIGLEKLADTVQGLIEKASDTFEAWAIEKLGANYDITKNYYGSVAHDLRIFTCEKGATMRQIKGTNLSSTYIPGHNTRKKEYEYLRSEISRNYANVRTALIGCKNAAEGREMLEKLGFDPKELDEIGASNVTTSLAAPIDPRFLFAVKEVPHANT